MPSFLSAARTAHVSHVTREMSRTQICVAGAERPLVSQFLSILSAGPKRGFHLAVRPLGAYRQTVRLVNQFNLQAPGSPAEG
jgi:hypothetical protein